MNCYGCHKIDGMTEGTLGPDLTEAGKKFKLDYLWESIVEPRANLATSFMPKFKLSDEDVKALVIFLKSRRGVNFAETSLDRVQGARWPNVAVVIPPGTAGEKAGEQLISGPRLHRVPQAAGHGRRDRAGSLLRRADPRRRMADGLTSRTRGRAMPDSIMPSFRFPDEDFQHMSAYLASLKTPPTGDERRTRRTRRCARAATARRAMATGSGVVSRSVRRATSRRRHS